MDESNPLATQTPIFSQSQSTSFPENDAQSESGESDDSEIRGDEGDEALSESNRTSTPRSSLPNRVTKPESLTDKVKNWIGQPGIQEKDAGIEETIDFI